MLDSTTNYDEDKLNENFGGSLMDSISHDNPNVRLSIKGSLKSKRNDSSAGDTLIPSDQASQINDEHSIEDIEISDRAIRQNTSIRQPRANKLNERPPQ